MNGDQGAKRGIERPSAFGSRRELAANAGLDRAPREVQEPLLVFESDHQIAAAI
jgi:hypothetical protein